MIIQVHDMFLYKNEKFITKHVKWHSKCRPEKSKTESTTVWKEAPSVDCKARQWKSIVVIGNNSVTSLVIMAAFLAIYLSQIVNKHNLEKWGKHYLVTACCITAKCCFAILVRSGAYWKVALHERPSGTWIFCTVQQVRSGAYWWLCISSWKLQHRAFHVFI